MPTQVENECDPWIEANKLVESRPFYDIVRVIYILKPLQVHGHLLAPGFRRFQLLLELQYSGERWKRLHLMCGQGDWSSAASRGLMAS